MLPALLFLPVGCALPSPPPPAAEFLVSANDATYWVQTGRRGFHIRRSPLILARAAGRYYELYVEDVDRSYDNAVFTGERIFRRDITTGDSTMIFEDTAVLRRSAAFHHVHPDEPSIDSRVDPPNEVAESVQGETDILNVLGPYVALEHRLSVDRGDLSVEDTVRSVIDVRSGHNSDIAAVAADSAAREARGIASGGERRWANRTYDVIARPDSGGSELMLVRDQRSREWRLGVLKSSFMQVFWLDNPKVDSRLRKALIRAFNEATAYGETVQLVSHKTRQDARAHPSPTT